MTHDWTTLDLTSPGLRLVYARWAELVDDTGPVSYQAPVSGAPQLFREWLEAVHTLEETGRGKWLQVAIEQELFGEHSKRKRGGSDDGRWAGTLNMDPVVEAAFGGAVALSDHRGGTLGGDGSAPAPAKERRLRAVADHFGRAFGERYVAEAISLLIEHVGRPPRSTLTADVADAAELVLSALVSDLLSRGFAASFLREHLDVLDGSKTSGTEATRWRAFLERLVPRGDAAPKERTMQVAVMVQCSKGFWAHWPGRTEKELSRVSRLANAPEPPEGVAHRFKPNNSRRLVAYEDVRALDHHAAANQAIQTFERTADLVTAEVVHPKPEVQATATRHGSGRGIRYSFADRDDLPLKPLLPRAADLAEPRYARQMLNADIDGPSLIRLEGALRAFRISRDATYTRTGLTNLWTALEALSPNERSPDGEHASIIQRVTGLVGPLMASFKATSLVDDVVGTLRQGGVIGTEVDRHLLVQLLANEDGVAWVESMTGGDPIVALHVRRFSKAMRRTRDVVNASYRTGRRVQWQVRRLYRLRNETVHGATTPQNARRVLQHLLLYVNRAILVLSDLLLAENGLHTIEAAASAIEVTYFEWAESFRTGSEAVSDLDSDALSRLLTPPYSALVTGL